MRPLREVLGVFARLHEIGDPDELRSTWRQTMATLGGAVLDQHPAPLEGLPPEQIQASIRIALAANLVDELDFLSTPARAACLYELGNALPPGIEKRELARRALKLLHDGDAPTFAGLATLLALGSSRALTGAPIQARVALCLDLPIGAGARADTLALALISRRETAREWLQIPSMGSLPSRRLAARLLERAAREAARRHAHGDQAASRVFEIPEVKMAWQGLLYDREPLVWRHVATARGLLTHAVADFADEVHRHLDPSLSPMEWRRAATSVAAGIAVDPNRGVTAAQDLLRGPIAKKDPGIASCIALGLPRAAEAEPAAVEELLSTVISVGDVDTFEALVDLRHERISDNFAEGAFRSACDRLTRMLQTDNGSDDGQTALMEALRDELSGEPSKTGERAPLVDQIGAALVRYSNDSARAAFHQAHEVVGAIDHVLRGLERRRDADSRERKAAFRALRELDVALLEKATLSGLLNLEAGKTESTTKAMGDLFGRMARWLFKQEAGNPGGVVDVSHPLYRMRRMKVWLHLVDADGNYGEDTSAGIEWRRLKSARLLLHRVRDDVPNKLSRVTCAACSRACDALVREEIFEVSDVLIAASQHVTTDAAIRTFAEASMVPEIKESLEAYAALHKLLDTTSAHDAGRRAVISGLLELANMLPIASTPRLEAFRHALLDTVHALEAIVRAPSLEDLLVTGGSSKVADLEGAVTAMAGLVIGARRRLGEERGENDPVASDLIRAVDFGAERAFRGAPEDLVEALARLESDLPRELPPLIARAIGFVLRHIKHLPVSAPATPRPSVPNLTTRVAQLPPWLPPGRTLGAFYVLRVLGKGAVGSVFAATRIEEKHKSSAKKFALKVPEYDGATARELSEQEFHQLFREEAGALLALPDHPNLARLVSFDAGAKPKPILVMELVEGPSLDRALRMQDITMEQAFHVLDGVAAGLEVMHRAGLGHLDVKPSNVILRERDTGGAAHVTEDAVLVDFGLAGRHVRPGCATGEYGAPEIWGSLGKDRKPRPMPADVYAFGCLAYEVFTGITLVSAPTEIALVTAHLSHDGNPPGIDSLRRLPQTEGLADLLHDALRQNPDDRPTISEIRARLAKLRATFTTVAWPLAA